MCLRLYAGAVASDEPAAGVSLRVEEVSAGVYRLYGSAENGRTVELSGTDPESLREAARRELGGHEQSE
jgi:hypothetical protein